MQFKNNDDNTKYTVREHCLKNIIINVVVYYSERN